MTGRLVFPCTILLLAAACATNTPAPATAGEPDAPHAQSRNSDVLTTEELSDASVRDMDALQAIRRLRPNFLRVRGVSSLSDPSAGAVQVSLDGGALQAPEILRTIRTGDLAEVRLLNIGAAQLRFGTAANAGPVILVTRR